MCINHVNLYSMSYFIAGFVLRHKRNEFAVSK